MLLFIRSSESVVPSPHTGAAASSQSLGAVQSVSTHVRANRPEAMPNFAPLRSIDYFPSLVCLVIVGQKNILHSSHAVRASRHKIKAAKRLFSSLQVIRYIIALNYIEHVVLVSLPDPIVISTTFSTWSWIHSRIKL